MDRNKLIDIMTTSRSKRASDQRNDWNVFWNRKLIQRVLDLARSYETNYYVRRILRPFFNKNYSFCELGCGKAKLLRSVAHSYKNIVGLDYSPDLLKKAKNVLDRAEIKNYKLIQQDIRDTWRIKPLYDVVFSNGLIEHFKQPHIAIYSHLMFVKPGGVVIILAPYKYFLKYLWFKVTDNTLLKKYWPWPEQYFFTRQSIEDEFEKIDRSQVAWHKVMVLHNVENVLLIVRKKLNMEHSSI